MEIIDRALALFDPDEDTRERAALLAAKARARMCQDRHDEATRVGREALALGRGRSATAWSRRGRWLPLAPALFASGDVDAGIASLREALEIARANNLPDELSGAYVNLADLLHLAGRSDEAIELARRDLEELERGTRGATGSGSIIAEVEFDRGDWGSRFAVRCRVRAPPGVEEAAALSPSTVRAAPRPGRR